MPFQSAKNVSIKLKEESVFKTSPGVSGSTAVRFIGSQGLNLTAADIRSQEARPDGLSTMGRSGSKQVGGGYTAEVSVGSHDVLYEAAMRGTWAVSLELDQVDVTSITTTTTTIVAASGSWVSLGIRAGDVVRLANHSSAGNNDRNLRVVSVTATTITVADTLTLNASADTSFTLTRLKKLLNPATPTKRTFTVEQTNEDIDGSQLFNGCRIVGFKITGTPDGMAQVEFTVLGAKQTVLEGVDSPYFTSPTTYNTDPLVFSDAKVLLGGTDIENATQFELTYAINAATLPVVGSDETPDVFDNDATLSGSFSRLREDFANVAAFVNETEYALHVLLQEPVTSGAPGCMAFYIPRIKYTGADAALGGDGGMIETLPFQSGAKTAATGVDATLLAIHSSAA
jgi:hypothetical protein